MSKYFVFVTKIPPIIYIFCRQCGMEYADSVKKELFTFYSVFGIIMNLGILCGIVYKEDKCKHIL